MVYQKGFTIYFFPPLGQMQATITPCPPAVPSSQASSSDLLPKEGLVVMQVQQALRETEGTLDLSIKKPRLQQDYNHSMQLHKPPTVTLYRPEPPPGAYYHPHAPHPEQGRGAKSPLIYSSSPRPQAPITPKMNKVTVPPPHPKLSPKLSSMGTPDHKGGSITHGTPVSTARYEGLLRQMTPPGNPTVTGAAPNASERGSGGAVNASSAVPGAPKDTGGSITQGTPVLPFAVDKRGTPMYDYHRTIRHSPVTGGNVPPPPPGQGPTSQAASPAVVVSHGGSQYNSYSTAGRPPPSYSMEQQLSSRQIIMNDYITSQQMHARARGGSSAGASVVAETTGKSEPPPPPSNLYYASTPPPSQTHTQPRQGVIQRHNPQKQMHYPPPPPGLEAFSSLVDVAVQQPSLPVPHTHGHPAASGSGGHEGLGKTMADRLLADRYDNNRAFREQEMRLQEHRMAAMQVAEHRLAVAAAVQHQRDRDRERDLVHLREKEEHRLHREKELQQLEHRLAVQQHHQQREKDLQQQEHRLAQQREKEMHVEHARLSVQQVREKDIQHEHRLSVHQQREKEIQQMVAAAAQREKEHEHRLAVQQQREKEMQQQERLAIQQQREKEHAEHRLAVQQAHRERDLAHLHQQQQQQQQQQIQQHIQQQRAIEAERRHSYTVAQIYRDHQQQQLDRDSSRLLNSGFSQSSRLQQSQQSQQQQSSSSSSRQSQSSSQQQNDSSTLTAASLIDAIITHQINQSVENVNASGSLTNQPARAGDRLFQVAERIYIFFSSLLYDIRFILKRFFGIELCRSFIPFHKLNPFLQGFHRETQQEPNGIAHSPAGEGSGGGSGGSGNGSSGNKAITLGEHVDHIVSKDYGPPHSSYRSYTG